MLRLPRLYSMVDDILRPRLGASGTQAVTLALSFSLATHWIGCIYYSLTLVFGFAIDNSHWRPSLTVASSPVHRQYMRALIFALKVFTWKGTFTRPDTVVELSCTILIVLIGLFASAYIIGNITSLVSRDSTILFVVCID